MFLVPDFKGFDFFPHGTRINFMRFKGVCLALSIVAMALSLALVAFKGLNFGVDFIGGIVDRSAATSGPGRSRRMREKLSGLGLGDVQIQRFWNVQDVLIRIEQQPGGEAAQQEALKKVTTALGRRLHAAPR